MFENLKINHLALVICSFLISFAAHGEDWEKFASPDGHYVFKLAPANNKVERELVLTCNGKTISSYRINGYIVDVLWSGNGTFVSINNRHSMGGDYVWIFSLPSGKMVKQPNDQNSRNSCFKVHKKYPEYKYEYGYLSSHYTFACKWILDKELLVCSVMVFESDDDAIIAVYDHFRMGNNGGYTSSIKSIVRLRPDEFKKLPAETCNFWAGWDATSWKTPGTKPAGMDALKY